MNMNKDILDRVKRYAEEFVEKEYPDEAPYFDIAWETFEEAIQGSKISLKGLTVKDLRGPTVRNLQRLNLEGDSTIMAPRVIRAFHILFTAEQRMGPDGSENLKQEMVQILSQKFSLELSLKIVDFFMENKGDQ